MVNGRYGRGSHLAAASAKQEVSSWGAQHATQRFAAVEQMAMASRAAPCESRSVRY